MKKKAKLIATLSSLGLALAMMVFAVYAATSVSFKVTTNVSFEATKHVQATITARDSGATAIELTKDSTYSNPAETGADQEIGVDSNGNTTGKVEDVKFKQTELTATNKYYGYQITITNNDDENALPISITTPEKQGQGYKITWDGNTITSIDVGETKKITCIIEIIDLAGNSVTINNSDLGLDIMLGKEDSTPSVIIQNDAITINPIDETTAALAYIDDTKLSSVATYSATPKTYSSEVVYEIPKTAVHTDGKEYTIIAIGYFDIPVLDPSSIITNLIIPDSVTTIGEYAFDSCESLISIDIPNSVTTIEESAFMGCTSLTSIDIPNSVTTIEESAFMDCTSLTSIVIPDSVTTIGEYAFEGAAWYDNQPDGAIYINKILYRYKGTMPEEDYNFVVKEGTVSISSLAFENCTSLTTIEIPDSVTTIGSGAFEGTTWYNNLINGVNGAIYINDVLYKYEGTMPEEDYNFVVKEGTISISCAAFLFSRLSNLTSIDLPDSLTTIGESAFNGCSSLTSIVIPDSVTTIGYQAFVYCESLTIYCEAASKPTGWHSDWNQKTYNSTHTPLWAGEWELIDGVPQPK